MKKILTTLHNRFINIPRERKRALMVIIDLLMIPVCLWLSFVLRFNDWWPIEQLASSWWLFLNVPLLAVLVFSYNRIYRSILRYVSTDIYIQIVKSVLFLAGMMTIAAFFLNDRNIPQSLPIIFSLICMMYVSGTRFLYRYYYLWVGASMLHKKSVLIYGAGKAGFQLIKSLIDSPTFKPIAFVDDDLSLQGSIIHGLKVYAPEQLNELTDAFNIEYVLLAMPSISQEVTQRISKELETHNVTVLSVPSMAETILGASIDNQYEAGFENLLGRKSVVPDEYLLKSRIENSVVLVTGGGGSIGSELCRQVLANGVKKLIVFDASEFNLYRANLEFQKLVKRDRLGCEIIPVLGSISDRKLVKNVLSEHKVEIVYHAAAYKHLPLVEQNVISAVVNNVFGTRLLCEEVAKAGVERFVLISSDKAVRSTNVMGATKRLAELVVQQANANSGNTTFCIVRFGNVLGSSGSVVPLFQKQIRTGGPVTVTHPDINRYFMTIPEAALLVIQAGNMAKGSEIFILDMGKKIKIVDLAKQMIEMLGFTVKDERKPDGDIEIQFIGLRPGEKLTEELSFSDAAIPTIHPRIMCSQENEHSSEQLSNMLMGLDQACASYDTEKAIRTMSDPITGYFPEFTDGEHNLASEMQHD